MEDFARLRLRPHSIALMLAALSLCLGFGMGAGFLAFEPEVKDYLLSQGQPILNSAYSGDQAVLDKVVSGAWGFLKRAYLHLGILGACLLSMIVIMAMVEKPTKLARSTSVLLGVGVPLYSLYWFMAGLSAPSMGGLDAAQASFWWLLIPGIFACTLGFFGVLAILSFRLFRSYD